MNDRLQRLIQLAWSAMDALIIVLYAVASIRRGRIPFWDDLQSIVALSREHGELALFIGLTGVAVHLSEAVKVWSLVLLVRSQRFAQATESQPV